METSINLYRKDNFGNVCIWGAEIGAHVVFIKYGILGKLIRHEVVSNNKNKQQEFNRRVNAKLKVGYKRLEDVSDDTNYPVEESQLIDYLQKYLPDYRTTSEGVMLPMLAKVYDKKLFDKDIFMIGQPKINGLRCLIGAKHKEGDMFRPVEFIFQSREGIIWKSLDNLGEELFKLLPTTILNLMLYENYYLDGELYIPGEPVNEINSAVKDYNNPKNKLIQYWCYDIAVEGMLQDKRIDLLEEHLIEYGINLDNKDNHITNIERLVLVPNYNLYSHSGTTHLRDNFINLGFEGVIIRNKYSDYQFGKRNSAMFKYKTVTDGKFTIIDIFPEGELRPDIPLLRCKNDINDATFDVHINGTFEYQRDILANKNLYIGKEVFIEYGERSGVTKVPFHVKTVVLINK